MLLPPKRTSCAGLRAWIVNSGGACAISSRIMSPSKRTRSLPSRTSAPCSFMILRAPSCSTSTPISFSTRKRGQMDRFQFVVRDELGRLAADSSAAGTAAARRRPRRRRVFPPGRRGARVPQRVRRSPKLPTSKLPHRRQMATSEQWTRRSQFFSSPATFRTKEATSAIHRGFDEAA